MPSSRDIQNKVVKPSLTKKEKLREEVKRSRKQSKGDDSSDHEDDFIDDEEEDESMDILDYRKLLAKLYPSKHANKKVEQGEKLKKVLRDASSKKNKNAKQVVGKGKKRYETESSESETSDSSYHPGDEDEDDYDEDDEDEEETLYETADEDDEEDSESESESDDEEEDRKGRKKRASKKATSKNAKKDSKEKKGKDTSEAKYNIIFTIEDKERDADYYDDEESYYEDEEDYESSEEENEDEEVSSCSSSEEDEEDDEESDEDESKGRRNKKMKKILQKIDRVVEKEKEKEKTKTKKVEESDKETKTLVTLEEEQDDETLLKTLKELYEKNKKNKLLLECIDFYEDNMQKQKQKQEKKLKKQKAKNERIFGRMVRDKSQLNDYGYFRTLEMEHQKKMIKEMRAMNEIIRVEKPYRFSILESSIPADLKASALKKINSLRYMEPGSGEYYKIKNWVDTFMRIPFGKYEVLPVTMENGVEACHDFMEKAQKTLNDAVYGLNDAKMQIMQMLGQLIINPSSV
jgi:hypothetical protein